MAYCANSAILLSSFVKLLVWYIRLDQCYSRLAAAILWLSIHLLREAPQELCLRPETAMKRTFRFSL